MVERIFDQFPEVEWISSCSPIMMSEDGEYLPVAMRVGYNGRAFCEGLHGGRGGKNFIQQESCFRRRSLWEKIGGRINTEYRFGGDFWLWSEFLKHAPCVGVMAPLAVFLSHGDQRSEGNRYSDDVDLILNRLREENATVAMPDSFQVLRCDYRDEVTVGLGRIPWKLCTYPLSMIYGATKLNIGDELDEVVYLRDRMGNLLKEVEVLQSSTVVKTAQALGLTYKFDTGKYHAVIG